MIFWSIPGLLCQGLYPLQYHSKTLSATLQHSDKTYKHIIAMWYIGLTYLPSTICAGSKLYYAWMVAKISMYMIFPGLTYIALFFLGTVVRN